MVEIKTKSARETQKVAAILAKEVINLGSLWRLNLHKLWRLNLHKLGGALVIALEGNLGSGKTTFIQGFARALGIKEKVLSPTFVLLKIYKLAQAKKFKHLIHIDCYRLDLPRDLLHLGFKELLKDKDAIILIEWADRITKLLPKDTLRVLFKHGKHLNERTIKILSTKS